MGLYDIIFNFFNDYFFNSTKLAQITNVIGGQTMTLNHWLSHTMSIISLVLIFVFLVLFIRWIFKVFSGLFR